MKKNLAHLLKISLDIFQRFYSFMKNLLHGPNINHRGSILILFFLLLHITAFSQLKADFSASDSSGCTLLVVQFMDNSTGNPTSWMWDLGNGTISDKQNPSTFYFTPGTYNIRLTVKNAAGETNTITKTQFITVYAKPTVEFSASLLSGCMPVTVNFTDQSTTPNGGLKSWIWDFGDGTADSIQNPTHTYNVSDSFSVSLIVTDSVGCIQSLLKTSYVAVADTVHADFLYTYSDICQAPADFSFTNRSTGGTDFEWSFGDGGISNQRNPLHTYTTKGGYDITLIAKNKAGCNDTTVKSISIGTQFADFYIPPTGCINESVFMRDSSSPVPVSGTWLFGDGTSDTGLATSHVYSDTGTYQITHTVNFGGCTGSNRKTIKIVNKPAVSFNSPSVRTACSAPLTIQFNNTSVGATDYLWDFGDSTTSTDVNPAHTYTDTGLFTVKLIAYNFAGGCSDSIVQTEFVKISPPVIKGFLNLPYSGCFPATVTFKADLDTSEPIKAYLWDFEDGTTSTSATPVHVYTTAGKYNIKLTITSNSGCTDTLSLSPAVILNDKPVANFKAAPLDACASSEIQFTDLSTGTITSREWLFGDNSFSTQKNPKHKFQDTGNFTITLYVTNEGCFDTLIMPDYIHITAPVAEFASVSDCNNKLSRTFSDSSIGAESWNWDFGDGTSSTVQNPTHTYATTGVYNVTLIVANSSCADTITHLVYIVDENPTLTDTALHSNFCKYDSIRFRATKYDTAFISNFLWDFGDGNISSGPSYNPAIHEYHQAGNYNPILITTDINGCNDTAYNSTPFNIYGPTPLFTNSPGTCVDSLIVFTDTSTVTHPLKKWIWDYGDSNRDTLTAPPFSHSYTNRGTYNVKLIVNDSNGCTDSLLKFGAVTITKPVADFGVLDSLRCTTARVTFINFSTGVSLKYLWDFGDGISSIQRNTTHTYAAEGIYSVGLTITDPFGCTDSIHKTDFITISDPRASFIISDSTAACPPLLVQAQNTSQNFMSSFWDFGDDNTSIQNSPFHSYTIAGNYNMVLIVHGYGNCYDTAAKTINLKGPKGEFEYTPLEGCYPQQVTFNATTENTFSYIWDFGNGSTQTTNVNTTGYNYDEPGAYIPKLILEDTAGCRVLLTTPDTLKIAGASAKFAADVQTGCDSSLVVFTDSSIVVSFDGINSRKWDFGDSTFSSDPNPVHYYKTSGTYSVSLFIQTKLGCTEKYNLPITVNVNKSPVIKANFPDSVCVNTPVNFTVTDNANIADSVQWSWNFGNSDTSNIQNPAYTYITAGNFNVTTMATAATGCADTVQKNIAILALPPVNAGIDTFLCLSQSLLLQPSGAASYEWVSSPSLSCTKCTTPLAVPDTTTTYYVTGTNSFGCKATDSININVIQPTQLIVPVTNDTLCIGSSLQLNVTGAEQYNWQPATGLSSSTIGNPFASPTTSTVYTVIGSDSKKCFADTAQISILVAPLPSFNILDSAVTINVGSTFPVKTKSSPDVIGWAWLPPYGLNCPNCAEPVAQPKSNVTYTAQAITGFGCTATDNIVFNVVCNNANIFIPNTFSPNGDSRNDYFYPQGTGLFTIKSLRIFNRWGVLVFAKANFGANIATDGWDGKYNGIDQQPDVYVYIMDVLCDNGTVLSYKGNVTLIR